MNEIRKKKLESSIQREVALHIQRFQQRSDGIGFVSVTRVELRPDFSEALIFVSPFGSEDENKETVDTLRRVAGQFQSDISRSLHLRVTPRFLFKVDNSIKEGDRILEKINELPLPVPDKESGEPTT